MQLLKTDRIISRGTGQWESHRFGQQRGWDLNCGSVPEFLNRPGK